MTIYIQNLRSLMLRCFDDDTKFSDLSKYEFVQRIENDSDSLSYLMREINTNNFYVFRIINNQRSYAKEFLESIELFKHINLPNINKIYYYNLLKNCIGIPSNLYDCIITKRFNKYSTLFIVDYFQKHDLELLNKDYLQVKKTVLTPTIRNKIIFGVACAMKYLHKNKIFFRDLRPSNISLDNNLEPVLSFSQYSQILSEDIEIDSIAGTPFFMAPEVFSYSYDIIGFPADVYSYSIFLYLFFSTFDQLYFDKFKIKKFGVSTFKKEILKGNRFKRPNNIPDAFWDLIQACWKQNPDDRPTFDQITSELRDDKFALDEFGMKTNLDELHEYQDRVDVFQPTQENFDYLMDKIIKK